MTTIPSGVFSFGGSTTTELLNLSAPIPAGVMTVATDSGVIKIGDGITMYYALPVLITLTKLAHLSAAYAQGIIATEAAVAAAAQAAASAATAVTAVAAANYAARQAAGSAALSLAELETMSGVVGTLSRQIAGLVDVTGPALITATGTTLETATPITGLFTIVTAGALGSGVAAPEPVIEPVTIYVILNRGPNAILLYPYSNSVQFEDNGAGNAVTIEPGNMLHILPVTPTLEYVY